MKIKLFILLFCISASAVFPQRFLKMSVETGGKTGRISYLTKNEISYVPVTELAKIFNVPVYVNSEASKAELKFSGIKLKITGRSQFIVATDASSKQRVYQIPVSTLLVNGEIFIPVIYTSGILSAAAGRGINFSERDKNIEITDKPAAAMPEPEAPAEEKIEPPVSSSKYDITGIEMEEKSNGTLIRLKTSRKIPIPKNSVNKNTLFVFLSNIKLMPNIAGNLKPAGLVKGVNTRYISSGNVQLEFQLGGDFSSQDVSYAPDNDDILIALHNKVFDTPEADSGLEAKKSKWELDTIVIDAGHGGKDAGAIGVNGTKEKDVNLAIALKLGKLISRNLPGIKVVYTRSDDTFIELYKRGKIANDNGGKLFISIHCNSMPKKPSDSRGFEVYLLRLGKTKEAVEIAEFENSVIKYEDNPARYKKLTDENFIFVSMAHSAFMRFSESFSDLLNQSWGKDVETPSRGVKQAGFYVLVGASMPSVLIETGFLSNPQEEKFLAGNKGQNEVSNAIFDAIKKYKSFYESSVLEKNNTQ